MTMRMSLTVFLSIFLPLSPSMLMISEEIFSDDFCHIGQGINIDINVWFDVWCIFIDGTEDGSWHLFWSIDLQEGVIVWFGLFALGTVIKVLAYAAFVPGTDNWELSTAIALASLMDNLSIFDIMLLFFFFHLGKHFTGILFELFLEKLLESLFGNFVLFSIFLFLFLNL